MKDYASIAQPLYDLLKGHGKDSDTVCMEEVHLKAFNDLKRALCQAPALGIAQSDRPFVLYVHEHLGFMTACLMQDHGGSLRPIHFYSGKLDIVAQGMGPCLRAVQAVHLALQASSGMVLGQTVNVKCPHAVSALMNQAKVTSVTSSRWGNWLATLTAPNIVIQRAPVTNPSSCMMSAMTEFVLEDEGEMTHDCVTLTYAATSEIAETPIENTELELFVDGSAQVIEGNRRAGYAVTSTTEVVASGRHLQVDYISLPPCKGKTDVLVVIDKFSRWVEPLQQGVLQLHILLNVLSLISFPDGDYQIALTQIKVPTSQDR